MCDHYIICLQDMSVIAMQITMHVISQPYCPHESLSSKETIPACMCLLRHSINLEPPRDDSYCTHIHESSKGLSFTTNPSACSGTPILLQSHLGAYSL